MTQSTIRRICELKRLITFFMIFCTSLLVANEYVTVTSDKKYEYHNHESYEVWYDKVNMNPAYVIWDVTAEDAIISAENNHRKSWSFNKCKSAPNASKTYKNTGYDRGHMCPNEDRDLSEDDAKNTFRGCNVCPQTHNLNAGVWKTWEEKEREYAKKYGLVTVVAGPIYIGFKRKIDVHTVPNGFFKIIIIDRKPKYVVLFTNLEEDNKATQVKLKDIENLTGLKFKIK